MFKTGVAATLLLASLCAMPASAEARPALPQSAPAISNVLPIQYWERCRFLRERIREAEGRLYYAPPWQRPRIEHRLWEARREFRESCRRY